MAELLAEAEFIEKKQSAKINGEKLKLDEKIAKSKTKVEILEELDIEECERFHCNNVCTSKQLAEFHEKQYFTTKIDDQALVGQDSYHHGTQKTL